MKPKAVILAAGKGARLDRHDNPKPLVRIGHEPMIIRLIRQLQEAGVEEISIVVGYRGDEIRRELTGHADITARIEFVAQQDAGVEGLLSSFLVGSANLDAPTIVTMADLVFVENPFRELAKVAESGAHSVYTLVGTHPEHLTEAGAQSRVRIIRDAIAEIGTDLEGHNGIEAGAYVVPYGKYADIQTRVQAHDIRHFVDLLRHMAEANLLGHIVWDRDDWYDVNTPALHVRANMLVRNAEQPSLLPQSRAQMREVNRFSFFARERNMRSDIIIERGLLKNLSSFRLIPEKKADSPHFIITDSNVDALYGDAVLQSMTGVGYNVKKFVVPEGEKSKNIDEYSRITDGVFSYGLDKNSIIFSLGGGVVNNLAGVLASTLYRGVELQHIATSSMSQVDAALDFKQAINSRSGKNLIGSYYPASRILIDPEVLTTLPERHLRNGIAESLKHALTQDVVFVNRLLELADKLSSVDVLEEIIRTTIELKVPLLNGPVGDDRNEMLPQYGHSVGHALEHLSGYELLHGEAISIGVAVSAEVARLLGICDKETVKAHYDLFSAYKLPTIIPDSITAHDILDALHYDKHFVKGSPHMGLPVAVGAMWNDRGVYSVPVDTETLRRAIDINKSRS